MAPISKCCFEKTIVNARVRTSEYRKTPRYWGAGVKGGLHQLLEDSLVLVEDDEAWLEEARAGGSEVPFGRIEC